MVMLNRLAAEYETILTSLTLLAHSMLRSPESEMAHFKVITPSSSPSTLAVTTPPCFGEVTVLAAPHSVICCCECHLELGTPVAAIGRCCGY